jgi:hypothetical protein
LEEKVRYNEERADKMARQNTDLLRDNRETLNEIQKLKENAINLARRQIFPNSFHH